MEREKELFVEEDEGDRKGREKKKQESRDADLLFQSINVVAIDVRITDRVHKVARFQACSTGYDVRQ